ncbi:MAG: hypothetical protein C0476_09090 [Sphingomonas sp.]|nr:hypothetical protein [Sphingomonas sp.]
MTAHEAPSDQPPAEPMPIGDPTSDTAQASGTARKSAGDFARQAADKARELAADGKDRAGSALDEVARMMGSAADTVDEKLGADYGKYARSAADGIASFSDGLKAKEIDDLLNDVQGFVRKSPAIAIGVAAAVGFVVARLVKAGLDGDDDQTVDASTGASDSADA